MGVILLPLGVLALIGWPVLLVEAIIEGFGTAYEKTENAIGELINFD